VAYEIIGAIHRCFITENFCTFGLEARPVAKIELPGANGPNLDTNNADFPGHCRSNGV